MSRYYMTPFESMIGHTTLKTVNKFAKLNRETLEKSGKFIIQNHWSFCKTEF